MSKNPDKSFNERAQHLLKVLVSKYIQDGQPVGSKSLLQAAGLDVSSATVRNIMSDLEEMGFVESPHTSAGRIPTIQGYRFFVDNLVSIQSSGNTSTLMEDLKSQLEGGRNTQDLMKSVSQYLSGVTRLAGVVTQPKVKRITLNKLEFMPLSDNRILAILVTSGDEVQNRILNTHRAFSSDELRKVSNYLNSKFIGKDLPSVRQDLVDDLKHDSEHMGQLMKEAVEMADKLFEECGETDDLFLEGQTNLMEFEELSNISKLRKLFEIFNEKQEMLHILDQCINANGVQIFIGKESGYQVFDDCSVVTSPYSVNGEVLGVLGVIGPTRMRYDRVIPIVDITAKVLGATLNSKF